MRVPVAVAAAVTYALAPIASGQVINEDRKLLPGDGAANAGFGSIVAASAGRVLIGAREYQGQSGSAYIFDAETGDELFKLAPSGGVVANDGFGAWVALQGNVALVSALYDSEQGFESGAAYLFDVSTGQQLHKLLPEDGVAGDVFGSSVAISNAGAVIGACWDDDRGSKSGSAYLFSVSTGQQAMKYLPEDGAPGDEFGRSVAFSGGRVVVGAPFDDDNGSDSGSVYVFDASTGDQLYKLLPEDGQWGDWFGMAIAISGGQVVVGAPNAEGRHGAVYVFDLVTGEQLSKITASDGDNGDRFGNTLAVSGSLLAVGAWGNSVGGSAYVFDLATGEQIAKLRPSDPTVISLFGWGVGVSGETAFVGAIGDDDQGEHSGSVYVFDMALPSCPADTNNDGVLSPADFSAWIAEFNTNGSKCDQNADGLCTPADFSAWVANYNAGCP